MKCLSLKHPINLISDNIIFQGVNDLLIYLLQKKPLYLGNSATHPHQCFAGAVQILPVVHEMQLFGLFPRKKI